MTNTIAITSDLHVRNQFPAGVDALVQEIGCDENLRHVDLYIAGDIAVINEPGKWEDDPGYAAKKRVRKELAAKGLPSDQVEARARQAQRDAWETHTDEMIAYGLRTQDMAAELMEQIAGLVDSGVINPLLKVLGNSTAIVANAQREAFKRTGETRPTIEDMIAANSHAIHVLTGVRYEQYGSDMVVTIPYTEDKDTQEAYLNQLLGLTRQPDIQNVMLIYHENRMPELVGMAGKPVVMACLHDMVDVVKSKYPNATVYEVVGHNHVIPEDDFKIQTPDNTLIVPVGVDAKRLVAATLIKKPGEAPRRIDYKV